MIRMRIQHVFIYTLLTAVILNLVGLVLPPYWHTLLADVMVWSIFTIGYNIIGGYAGLHSFCHGVFFGGGAYAAAWSVIYFHFNVWGGLAMGLLFGGITSFIIGILTFKQKGAQFAILTFVITLIAYLLSLKFSWLTGGIDGINYSPPPLEIGTLKLPLYLPQSRYHVASIFFMISIIIAYLIDRSPFGLVLHSIRENEERCRFLGYPVVKYRIFAFVISGMFSGFAGALYSLMYGFANPAFINVQTSLNAITWMLIGGAGTAIGPVIGVAIMLPLLDYLSTFFKYYLIITGIILIICIQKFREGIIGYLKTRVLRVKTYA
jgi:branched-chain amino acid transport system permease protein